MLPEIGDVWVSPKKKHVYLIIGIERGYARAVMLTSEDTDVIGIFHDMTDPMPASWERVA